MAEINAKDVMALRNRTGLAMMECKKALAEAGGDVDQAEELLRKKLKGKMEKRADRPAGEGVIAIALGDGHASASIIELRCETDFTAKNADFLETAEKLATLALVEPAGDVSPNAEMQALIDNIKIKTGENISMPRAVKVETSGGSFGSYVHHDRKVGVLLVAEGGVDEGVLKQVGMHVTAAVPRPLGVSQDDVPAELVEKERQFRVAQAVDSGKPQEIAEKMVEGGMRKFYAEVALLEQKFVMDESKTIKDVVAPGTVTAFHRWEVGEEA